MKVVSHVKIVLRKHTRIHESKSNILDTMNKQKSTECCKYIFSQVKDRSQLLKSFPLYKPLVLL